MCVNCLRYLLVGCCKPHCGALAATCAGGKRPLTATTRLKALPRPPPLRGGFRGVVSYRVRFATGLLVGCCKPRCGALAATCAGGKRPLTATTRLKALPRPPPLRGGFRGVVSYHVRFAAGLLVGCCKPRCGALAATCAGGKRPLTATTRLKALPRPPPLRGGFRGVVSYRVRFATGLLVGCCKPRCGALAATCAGGKRPLTATTRLKALPRPPPLRGGFRGVVPYRVKFAAGLVRGCCVRAALRAGAASARPCPAVPARLALLVQPISTATHISSTHFQYIRQNYIYVYTKNNK